MPTEVSASLGRDLSVNRQNDLLEGIQEEKVKEVIAGLNPSQRACIETHRRNVHHGINMIIGPFGSGKTVLASKFCELQKLRKPDSKTLVTASSIECIETLL